LRLDRIAKKIIFILSQTWLNDFNIPLANNFEKLHGDREGQYSIRINDQFIVCFEWNINKAINIEVINYHK
jgi:proteic killer suppression protein